MTVFPVGEDSLMLCSRCYAVVTQPWHDKLRETSDALAEAQRENEELRADLVWAMDGDNDTARGNRKLFFRGSAIAFDGTDADLCRAIREARRGE